MRRLAVLVTAVIALAVITAMACRKPVAGPEVKPKVAVKAVEPKQQARVRPASQAMKEKQVPVIDRATHTRFPRNRAGQLTSRGGQRRFLVTAYSAPCRRQGTGTRTATGFRVYKKIGGKLIKIPGCAVDPSVIPLGSIIRVGARFYEADDTGSGVKGCHIDLRLDSYEQAKAFGRRRTPVEIYRVHQENRRTQ